MSRVLRGAVALLLPTVCSVNDFTFDSDSLFATKTYACAALGFPAGNITLSVDSRGTIYLASHVITHTQT
jgi:glucokinase